MRYRWVVALVVAIVALHTSASFLTAQEQVYETGPGITSPRLVRDVRPSYAPEAMRAKVQGKVWLRGVVATDGTIRDVVVTQSLHPELDEACVAAFRKWEFEPGMKDGKEVPVRISVVMAFALRR